MNILIVEDDANLREAVVDTIALHGYRVTEADSGETAVLKLKESNFDFIVSDVSMPGMSGHDLLDYVRQNHPQIPMLLVTAYAAVDRAVDAMQKGAVDYLVKPFTPTQLIELIDQHSPISVRKSDDPIAVDASSQHVLSLARKVATTDSTILISGESGTGKEVLARYIHQKSGRAEAPFVAINCAAIPENMLEATLFGHEKGAFTGAVTSQPGKFEQANGGTLLLDEISEMDLGLQAKLLRVLQEKEVERIGGRKVISLDVRVLATTNRELVKEVKAGRFREDLYYRLSVFPLAWHPLRERKADIIPLAESLLRKHGKKMQKPGLVLDQSAKEALLAHSWPGNIRELDNAIQRALILQTGQYVSATDLGIAGEHLIDFESHRNEQSTEMVIEADSPREPFNDASIANEGIHVGLKHKEFELILDALRIHNGRKNRAADYLGISSRTLRYKLAKMREIGMDVDAAIAEIR
ncbi:sigma-54-dependent transcriptional regulator [Reinekea blandensis]|uniref:Sigma-54 dependent transcriptional regulator/response regulator FleR n=1 Tax=Reinekea blandensis MED297 TaxID=314283 RepID=A4BIM8_9GAMM|nr:sigma-54 dependent transcriptional regulator [Reinekea blandensis]EAR07992.1 sigma-54 dependent transcriptional regulator/response regulator FleR [Reinekea sp. MED297] [Reinekea blandensis MED297]